MSEPRAERITCATYTHARRHPMVLGKIGDWTPPVQLTLPQIGVFLLVLFIQVQTWQYWGAVLPRALSIVAFVAVPAVCAWAVRRARWEGRSLPRAVVGWATLWTTANRPLASGRAYSPTRPHSLRDVGVYVVPGPPPLPPPRNRAAPLPRAGRAGRDGRDGRRVASGRGREVSR